MDRPFSRMFEAAMRRYHAMRIGTRMVLLYLLAGLAPLLITNIYASNTLNVSANDRQMQAAERGYEQTVSFLGEKLYRILRMSDVIALDATLNDCIYNRDLNLYTLSEQIADMNTILTLLSQKRNDLDIYDINLYVRDDLIYSHRADMISGLGAAAVEPWYRQLIADNYQAVFCAPDSLPREGILAIARRVRNLDNLNQVEAVLRIDFPLNEVEQILLQGCTAEGSASMIVDIDGTLVAASHPEAPDVPRLDVLIKNAGAKKGFFAMEDDPSRLIQCTYIPHTDWYLVTVLSQRDMARASLIAWVGVFALVLAATLPSLLLAQRILGAMTGRLKKLGKHMQSVRLGELAPTEWDENRDEIGEMTDDYNYMISRMNDLLDEQYRIGQEARSAELLALQSQINPHFLYNTLDMLTWMARRDQTEQIQTVIRALSNFYRLSLNRGQDIVTLSDELALINSYMTIQHLRFGDTVSLDIDVEQDAQDCLLPKITLQPLVENALLHGILPRKDKSGGIVIRGRLIDKNLRLQVEDDGIGIPKERQGAMLLPARSVNGRHGYGIHNIEKRMCLYFHLDRCLEFGDGPEKGTVVTMVFPAWKDGEPSP